MLTSGGTGSWPCSSGAHRDTLGHPLPPRPAFWGAGETAPFRAAPTVAPRFWRATPNQSRGCQGRFLQGELAGAPGGSSRLRPSVKLVVPAQPTPALGSLLSVHTWPPPLLEGARPLHPPRFCSGRGGLVPRSGVAQWGVCRFAKSWPRGAGGGAGPGAGLVPGGKTWRGKAKIKYECKMQSRRGSWGRVCLVSP